MSDSKNRKSWHLFILKERWVCKSNSNFLFSESMIIRFRFMTWENTVLHSFRLHLQYFRKKWIKTKTVLTWSTLLKRVQTPIGIILSGLNFYRNLSKIIRNVAKSEVWKITSFPIAKWSSVKFTIINYTHDFASYD